MNCCCTLWIPGAGKGVKCNPAVGTQICVANKPLAIFTTSFLATFSLVFVQDSTSNASAPVLFEHTELSGRVCVSF